LKPIYRPKRAIAYQEPSDNAISTTSQDLTAMLQSTRLPR